VLVKSSWNRTLLVGAVVGWTGGTTTAWVGWVVLPTVGMPQDRATIAKRAINANTLLFITPPILNIM
jgi:hypothetical protein